MLLVLPLGRARVRQQLQLGLARPARFQGFRGALLVTTLSYYPFVYLPAAAALRGSDPALEETARSLGLGPWRTFWRVTLPQLRVAILGGGLIIALHLLAEYGAFATLRFPTFATEIFAEYQLGFDGASAALLSLVVVVLSVALPGRRARPARPGPLRPGRLRGGPRPAPGRPRPGAAGRPRRRRPPRRARPRRPGRDARLLARARRLDDAARRPRSSAPPGRRSASRRRPPLLTAAARPAGRRARRPPPLARVDPARAQRLPGPRAARGSSSPWPSSRSASASSTRSTRRRPCSSSPTRSSSSRSH